MTKREFYAFVIANVDNEEIVEIAKSEIALLDKKNDKAKEKRMAIAKENEPILANIKSYLSNHKSALASEIALACEISTPKAVAMCNKLVDGGIVSVKEISVPKVGKRKSFALIGWENDNDIPQA